MTDFSREHIQESMVEAARRLDALGLVPATGGNISARIGEDAVLITRTHVRKRHLRVEDLVEVRVSDGVAQGPASSELGVHLTVYRERPQARAVVHAHPPAACAFAVAGKELREPLMPEPFVYLGAVPLVPYATPGTPAMEEAVAPVARTARAFLLANHGAVTQGASVEEAVDRMETLEHLARVSAMAEALGGAKPLSPEDIRALEALLGGPENSA